MSDRTREYHRRIIALPIGTFYIGAWDSADDKRVGRTWALYRRMANRLGWFDRAACVQVVCSGQGSNIRRPGDENLRPIREFRHMAITVIRKPESMGLEILLHTASDEVCRAYVEKLVDRAKVHP